MRIDLEENEAELLRDVLQQRVSDLDREISRTDSLAFKRSLQDLERLTERVLGRISESLEGPRNGNRHA